MSGAVHPYDAALGALLREQRLDALVKQRDLAEALHVTRATVTRWEQGIRGLNVATLLTLADTLGIPGSHLLPEAHRERLDPTLAAIVHILLTRPDLVPTVQAMLEMLIEDDAGE
ncbi:helix-turn-helix domain-containing protein [Candidatus Oscillochloris fontis]|uniref:helix-turn-helix domain-containing protein n=1 Tax=Candidatus Oscillochloris fontis TaxID=2496868 RepID=UPI0013758A72|nr:helix-turn-helix transcriptional regulator [Candidatus Oscillochloris fontis]